MEINNYLSVIKAHKLLIKANMNKLPDYFEDMYDSTDDELRDELIMYKKEGIINGKYYGLLESVAKLINKYNLVVSIVKKSELSLINNYYRIKSLSKAYFSEPEEVKAASRANGMSEVTEWSEQSELSEGTQVSDDETGYESERSEQRECDESEINDEVCDESERGEQSEWDERSEVNASTNKKPTITNKEHENDLRIILKQAIKNNDRQLMLTTMELLKKFDENKSNTSTPSTTSTAASITNTKTPTLLIPLKCTVNPENNKKLNNQSFKYGIAASKKTGDKKFRLTNIEKHLNKFNFKNITYPPNRNDYVTFENNNLSIKLIILKESSKEKRLCLKYNDTNKNDRSNRLFLIHLNSNHYIYVTKPELLLRKYLVNID